MKTRTIFYINIGNLPQKSAMKYLEEMKAHWNEQGKVIPDDQVMYIPVRESETRVEVLVYPQE